MSPQMLTELLPTQPDQGFTIPRPEQFRHFCLFVPLHAGHRHHKSGFPPDIEPFCLFGCQSSTILPTRSRSFLHPAAKNVILVYVCAVQPMQSTGQILLGKRGVSMPRPQWSLISLCQIARNKHSYAEMHILNVLPLQTSHGSTPSFEHTLHTTPLFNCNKRHYFSRM